MDNLKIWSNRSDVHYIIEAVLSLYLLQSLSQKDNYILSIETLLFYFLQ